jgi:hypothetical protein
LVEPAATPTTAELSALRSIVAETARGAAQARAQRWRRRVAAALAGAVVLSGGTAYATSGSAPRPVRSAAFALKLPVEAPDVTDAKRALADLAEQLSDGRRDKVVKALVAAERELAELTPTELASLEPGASSLLASARSFVADPAVEERLDDDAPVESELDEHRDGAVDDRSGSEDGRRTSGSGSDDGSGSDSSGGSGSSGSDDDGSDDGRSGSSGSGSSGSDADADSGSGDDGVVSGSGSSGSGSSGSDSGSGDDGVVSGSSSGSSDGSERSSSSGTSGSDGTSSSETSGSGSLDD